MKEEIKTYIYTKLEECIYDKIVHPRDTWCEECKFELDQTQ